ncbi:MAG: hypothetical protein KF894_23700 [Labilithrix sp.]|nr:hypothetical protein [Labilithrix sp.]
MKSARVRLVYAGVVATAAMHLWCSSDDDAQAEPGQDAGSEDAGSEEARAETGADAGAATECTGDLCRVALPGAEALGLYGLHAKSASEIWLVGSRGFAARFDGAAWRVVPTGITAAIFGVTSTSDGTVWGASSGHAFLKLNGAPDGGASTVDGGFKGIVHAIGARGPDVFAVGRMFFDFASGGPPTDNIWRYGEVPDAGPGWHAVSPPCPMGEWEPECLELRAVWVESPARQWFAGDDGRLFRTDTSAAAPDAARIALTEMNSSSLRRLSGLWGFGANDVWAVGAQGVIRHYTGGDAWETVASPVTEDLYGVWGARPDDVWAVGDRGAVVHWDGATWAVKDVPFPEENRPRLYAVAGAGGDVWIAGAGVLLRSARAPGGDR